MEAELYLVLYEMARLGLYTPTGSNRWESCKFGTLYPDGTFIEKKEVGK